MKSSIPDLVRVRVPATTANLGPGFDCLGVALNLYNTVTLIRAAQKTTPPSMVNQTASAFFKRTGVKSFPIHGEITGRVPVSRGLGSSVTVRLGVAAGINRLAGQPISDEDVLKLVIDLEGHPDNAVPAYFGGFATSAGKEWMQTRVLPRLSFVAFIPEMELETKKARAVLPKNVSLADAVCNVQNSSRITAAFFTKKYESLKGSFKDTLHQPYRSKLLPCMNPILKAAESAGALGGYLSGAGSTLMAVTLDKPTEVRDAMIRAAMKSKTTGMGVVLKADNRGILIQCK